MKLSRDLQQRLDDALTPHDLTPALFTDLLGALRDYATATRNQTAPALHTTRREALERAARAGEALLASLDAIEAAWGTHAPDKPTLFIGGQHGRLRSEARRCAETWRAWLAEPRTRGLRRGERPAHTRRERLELAIVFVLLDAGIPLAIHRTGDVVQNVLREILTEADRLDGIDPQPRADLWRVAQKRVACVRAIEKLRTHGNVWELRRANTK